MAKYILLMAVTTYLIRMLPLVLFQKEIKNKYIQSFLYYVPFACLTAMTVPAIFYATGSVISAAAGLVVALFLGWRGKSLPTVALAACIVVFVVELFV
ncbi:MAG: AzlD domain-containing protein [Lachnospiraceae bacterium]|jgi:branched-subunit amino acid transport protein|nr:AzlD domain-containing protein [Lachnospiraceae bacterium]MBQ1722120.1 AzlD domain-containing protein [Lachnospiraceae bacterium]MBQ2503430.1 AzlD domain-containing protein [Lachnospiraceae bacterium]